MKIAEIRAREQAATPGEWKWDVNLKCRDVDLAGRTGTVLNFIRWGCQQAGVRFNVSGIMVRCDDERLAKVIPGREHHKSWARVIEHPDADFIAHARQDIPDLLDALERHGGHSGECMKYLKGDCTCGWDEIEEELK